MTTEPPVVDPAHLGTQAPRARRIEWSWVFDFVTMVTVVLGVTFAGVELRELRSAQESQAWLQLYQTLQQPDIARGTDILTQLPDTISAQGMREVMNGPDRLALRQVALTFEGIGVMVYRGDIDIEWVDETFRYSIITCWKRIKPLVLEMRAQRGYPDQLEWLQWLAERLEERAGRHQAPAYEAHRDWKPPR